MPEQMVTLKRTPLYAEHVKEGGKLIDFGGWEMPVQYTGVIEEHQAVRTGVGLFDVSHMGEITVKGAEAYAFVQHLIANDVGKISEGQILYTPMCYPDGGVVDDLLVYRFASDYFYLVVNAANTEKDFSWMKEQASRFAVELENISARTAQLALQGPAAEDVLQGMTDVDLSQIKYYRFVTGKIDDIPGLISRTGYTGEDGFEFYFAPEQAVRLWRRLLAAGEKKGIRPAGLGARDTLRLEAKLPLYGHELSRDISPLEAGIGMFVKLNKAENFIGREALIKQKEQGVPRKLVGLEMVERGIARAAYPIVKDGEEIGYVTSGSYAPTLHKNIALGLIQAKQAVIGEEVAVVIRNKPVSARIVPTPFYKREHQ